MTYDEALEYWYARVDFERAAPHVGDLNLDRMRELLQHLGDPHQKLKTIHITGSKGKGSTSAMLANVLRKAGFRVGLFVSPHLTDVRERIQVNAEPIPKKQLAELMAQMRPAIDSMTRTGSAPTFFEVGTALGFLHFLREECDLSVIEVGLGGRFDSTNVITPLLSIITSISLDHVQILGNSVALIAFEKAGIIKPGIPIVTGATDPAALRVIEEVAEARGSPLTCVLPGKFLPGRVSLDGTVTSAQLTLENGRTAQLGLLGLHQAHNAALVVAAGRVLQRQGVNIPESAILEGMRDVVWPARLEVFRTRPVTVIDCAHNVASAQSLVRSLLDSFAHSKRLLVFAVSSDKDVAGILSEFAPHFEHVFLTKYANNPRAMAPEEIAKLLPVGTRHSLHSSATDAWESAMRRGTSETLVVAAGSVFLAGELRPILQKAVRL